MSAPQQNKRMTGWQAFLMAMLKESCIATITPASERLKTVAAMWKVLSDADKDRWATDPRVDVEVEEEADDEEKGCFSYDIMSCVKPNVTDKNVTAVLFDIGRYGNCEMRVVFPEAVTEAEAIRAAEDWLNKPLTDDERNQLLEANDVRFGENVDDYWFRYEALGCCTDLEAIQRTGSTIRLICAD